MNLLNAVIPLEQSRAESLANVLSRIFCDEPPFTYLIPDRHERRTVLPGLMGSAIRSSQRFGETYTTPTIEGGALWIGPGQGLTMERIVRSASAPIPFKMSRSSLRRCISLGARMEQVREQLARYPHWYLVALGVESSRQEKALREALIEPVLSRADSEGLPCYLETFHETNLAFYEKQGFRIEGGGRIPGSGPDFWAMMRVPR